jgi:hypothetical protein
MMIKLPQILRWVMPFFGAYVCNIVLIGVASEFFIAHSEPAAPRWRKVIVAISTWP